MSSSKLDDLYDRLTSRKFLLTVLGLIFAIWNYLEGRLTAIEFQTAVTALIVGYGAVEGVTDAFARPAPHDNQATTTIVNSGSPIPESKAVAGTKKNAGAKRSRVQKPRS